MYRFVRLLPAALLALASLLAAEPARANHGSINGRVRDAVTSAGIPNVCVVLGPAQVRCATLTDAAGFYEIPLEQVPDLSISWELHYYHRPDYGDAAARDVIVHGDTTVNIPMGPTGQSGPLSYGGVEPPVGVQPAPFCRQPLGGSPTVTQYLPNVTKSLGGPAGFQTPFIVQNTGAGPTTLEVSFFRFADGQCYTRRVVEGLRPGTSFADVPNNDLDIAADTQYSVVVRSFGSPVVSVVNEHAGFGDTAQALSYDGFSGGATSVFLPNITRTFFGFHTPFIIQNLGASRTTATATFVRFGDGAPSAVITRQIEPGRSRFIEPNVEPALSDGTQYAVTVTASEPIAVVVNTHAGNVGYSTDGLVKGAAAVYGPYAAKNTDGIGRVSTIVVQNLGSAAITPSLTFTPLGGGQTRRFTSPSAISVGAAWAFDPRFQSGVASSDSARLCGAAATATCVGDGEYSFVAEAGAGGQVAAVVNVLSPATAMGYSAAPQPATKYFLPNVTRTLGGPTGWSTPIMLQAVSASGATLRWFRFSDGQLVLTQTVATPAGTAIRVDPRLVPTLSDDTQYSVVAEGTGGTITAVVVELAQGGDNAMIYEGFPAP